MKRYILLLAALLAAAGCYEDKGKDDDTELGDFYVDTEQAQQNYTRTIFSTFELDPDLVYHGDREDLDFSWKAYSSEPSMLYTVTPLGDTETLSAPITMMPGDYFVEFRATERSTGRAASHRYNLTVESSGAGMLVLYERDGRADFGLITPTYMFGNVADDAVSHDIFSRANPDYTLEGAPVALEMYKDANFQHITLLTESDGVRLSPIDMTVSEPFARWFSFPPKEVRPQGLVVPNGVLDANAAGYENSDGMEYMVSGGTVYTNVILFGFGSRTVFSERTMVGGYSAAPFVFQGFGAVTAYDTLSGGFFSGSIAMTSATKVGGELGAIGKEYVYMNYGYGSTYVVNAIFRDQSGYYFYVMNFQGNVLVFKADISAYTGIGQATAFAWGRRAPLAYYASGATVYQIKYNYEARTAEADALKAWDGLAAGETITALKLCPHPGRNLPDGGDTRDKYLFVGAYNESTREGKVYVLEVRYSIDGSIVGEPVAVYGGFGRIKDFGFKF
jgi:hypothetical protein